MDTRNILVFSIALGDYKTIFSNCITSHQEYCKLHQYHYLLVDKAPRALEPNEAAWLKIPFIISLLAKDYKWIVFIDADCEVRPHTPDFESCLQMLPDSSDKGVFVAPGFSGRINSGVMFIKNIPDALQLFIKILENADKKMPFADNGPFENGHVYHFAKSSQTVYMLDHIKWNNNSAYNESSYIQHYSDGVLREHFIKANSVKLKSKNIFSRFISKRFKNRNKTLLSDRIDCLMKYYSSEYPVFKK